MTPISVSVVPVRHSFWHRARVRVRLAAAGSARHVQESSGFFSVAELGESRSNQYQKRCSAGVWHGRSKLIGAQVICRPAALRDSRNRRKATASPALHSVTSNVTIKRKKYNVRRRILRHLRSRYVHSPALS
ncbi:hypothetical protein EVAR_10184_1 [Eumeta japonica]|uniref:Uncharacterized protein n=1 Tax=Eumeta variegata TaxID=151549 RepID=A0A4C1TGG1_EUMVA|nr:hypothetical protein EVAR_10184_1 [Eumeta japonica]